MRRRGQNSSGAPSGHFKPGAKVLYAHLGGVPAINAYSGFYRNG